MINSRLACILPDIIHHDQTGFILNRELRTNTRTCLSLIQYAKKEKIDLTLMAIDAEKAFDRLEREYLFKVMESYGFPDEFTNLIKTTYKNTTAQVFTNGTLSSPFRLNRGTAQGETMYTQS